MRSVAEALRRLGKEANVPMPWRTLSGVLHPLRGNLAIVLAEPGVGKSAFSLSWASFIDQPSCLLSLDTDLASQGVRMAAMLSGTSTEKVKQSPEVWADYLERKAEKIRMYDLTLGSQEIGNLVEADTEYWGVSPALTVVDNVGNLVREGTFEDFRRTFSDLHRVARVHDTFVLALHHTKRRSGHTAGKTPSLTSGQFTGEQEAEIVLGLSRPHEDRLRVAILKNRSGKSEPNGDYYFDLLWDHQTLKITEPNEAKRALWGLADHAR